MAKENLEVIRVSDITNNCPECFNQDMTITFFQKHRHGLLFHRITGETTHEIKCKKCNSIIYPVRWTDAIERIFEYNQKLVEPKKRTVHFTTLFYVLMLLLIIPIALGVYLYLDKGHS